MKKAITPEAVRRVLAVKLSSLGDLFHALPAVHNLKAVSGAAVDWVTQPEYADLAGCFTEVDRVIVFPRRRLRSGAWRFLRALRREAYDLVIDFQGLLKSAIPARLARGAFVLGPSFHREGTAAFYSACAGPKNKNRHAVEENLDVIRWLGWPEVEPEFPLRFPAIEPAGTAPRIGLVPMSRWATKNWPEEYFVRLGAGLIGEAGASLFILGSAAEEAACARIEQGLGGIAGVFNAAGRTSLVELGGLMEALDLVITVDSGPMHMAAAVGTPVLALFGPTDPARTGPYGTPHRVLCAERLACRPCYADRCARGDLACQRNLFPSTVLETALDMLRENGIPV